MPVFSTMLGSKDARLSRALLPESEAALQCAARAAIGALLQLISEPSDEQIATEPERRSGVMQLPRGTPQLLCRPIDQPGDFGFDLARARLSPPVLSVAVPTETVRWLARMLASRRILD